MNTQCGASVDDLDDDKGSGFLPLALPSLATVRRAVADDDAQLTAELLALAGKLGLVAAVEVLRQACAKSKA